MVSAAGNVAWAAADAVFKATVAGQELSLPARVTAVLEKRGDQWLVVQSHFSLPAPGEEGESFPSSG
jgi:ketosteroid isomerase-like protein